jgi:type I restriction enzyme M protein
MTETLKSIASGGTFAEFSKTSFEKIKIPLPPIEVQRKIVEEIENKQTAIDHARAIISTLERERELILTQALAPKKKAGQ